MQAIKIPPNLKQVVSCIFNVFNVTMNNILTSEGAAKTTMCALLTGAVLNIALDPLFIYVFDLGVAGAAIATAISQVVSTCVYLTYIFRKKSVFHFRVKDCTYTEPTASTETEVVQGKSDLQEMSAPCNFIITDDRLGEGGPKAKFGMNMEAIDLPASGNSKGTDGAVKNSSLSGCTDML